MTPKDEQNALITERDKYLSVIDAGFQLRQAEIQLLRQTGELESWLKSATTAQPLPAPTPKPEGLPQTVASAWPDNDLCALSFPLCSL